MESSKRYRIWCVYCGSYGQWSGRGRQPLFCSPRCRTASKRAADRGECVTPADCTNINSPRLSDDTGHTAYCATKRERALLAGGAA